MNYKHFIFSFILGIFLLPIQTFAQVDFNKIPQDDLGNVTDAFQENFFEALKQKGIENYEKAVLALERCLEIDHTNAVIYFELGKNYNALKNFGAAEEALEKAIKSDPKNRWYLDELYDVYAKQNDFKNAIKTVAQLVKYYPDYKMDLAVLYSKTKNYNDAIKLLDEMDAENGVSEDRDALRNKIYNATGNTEERIENLEDRIESNPDLESNYLSLIYRYCQNNDNEKAYETALELLKKNPESERVHLALYKLYLNDSKTEQAVNSMKIALTSNKIQAEAKMLVFTDFLDFVKTHPQYEQDLVTISSKIIEQQNDTKTYEMLGQYYLVKGDKANALENFSQALNLDPNNFNALKNVLLLKIDLQQYEHVVIQSVTALSYYPSQPILYLLQGISQNALSQPENALESLKMGLDYIIDNPKMEADFYMQISQAYTQLNNTTQANAFKEKAIRLQNKIHE